MSEVLPDKDCPDCGMKLALDTNDFTFYCPDVECAYTEFCEDGKPAEVSHEEEDEEGFKCPHCGEEIAEDLLP